MCFPTKRQRANFSDDIDEKLQAKPIKPAVSPDNPSASSSPTSAPPASASSTAQVTVNMSSPKIAIVIYSLYGHIAKMAEAVKVGIAKAGGSATIYQVPETLSQDILDLLHAPPKPDYPIIDAEKLATYDAFIMGIPTRYGNFPSQWKAFWDSTGPLWAKGALAGKYAGVFVSTASSGGGQEATAMNSMSTLAHHGIIFVPLGYSQTFALQTNLSEVHGGSPWGAGTLAAGDGSRQPTALELEMATIQGKQFYDTVSRVKF
ncbi:NADH-quinone oxidoreductase [Fistulina hepatica ATCC 64428]|uniref:NADH-quinone oxidoreductase n=1 Tax=Fistulina hepatica ATCC 64428 TaxID=1128425 RepID=A0A0D7ACJ4_9AGAR|nr:NADH-quinone oxidoreductase [Fistulina hepatica ATCC 64428]